MRLVLLGVGAMNSPRYRPAGLLVAWAGHRVMSTAAAQRIQADHWMRGWSATSAPS